MRFLRFRLRLVMVLRFVVVMMRRLVCRLSVMVVRWLALMMRWPGGGLVVVVRRRRRSRMMMMVVVVIIVIPIALNQGIQHEFAGGKQQCNRCTQRNCQRLYFEYNRHLKLYFLLRALRRIARMTLALGPPTQSSTPAPFAVLALRLAPWLTSHCTISRWLSPQA